MKLSAILNSRQLEFLQRQELAFDADEDVKPDSDAEWLADLVDALVDIEVDDLNADYSALRTERGRLASEIVTRITTHPDW